LPDGARLLPFKAAQPRHLNASTVAEMLTLRSIYFEIFMNLQIFKWGNSLAMRIPSDIVRRFGLRDGDSVDAGLTIDGALTIRPTGWSRRAFAVELGAIRAALPVGPSVMAELRRSARH
jgi:antitoxin MazE